MESVLKVNEVQVHTAAALNGDVASKSHDQTKSESVAVEVHTGSGDSTKDVCLGDAKITAVQEALSTGDTTGTELGSTVVVDGRVVEKEEGGERSQTLKKTEGKGEEKSEEKFPVPPPRRKRKNKKMMNKQPSLENLREVSMTSERERESVCVSLSLCVCVTERERERGRERGGIEKERGRGMEGGRIRGRLGERGKEED